MDTSVLCICTYGGTCMLTTILLGLLVGLGGMALLGIIALLISAAFEK